MDMKNTVILLIFLLSVVGLMIGVSNTYDNSALNPDEYDEIITEHDNGTIFIHLEKKERFLDPFFGIVPIRIFSRQNSEYSCCN